MSSEKVNIVVFVKGAPDSIVTPLEGWCAERYPQIRLVYAVDAADIERQGLKCCDVDAIIMWDYRLDQIIGFYERAGPAATRRLRWVHSSWAGLNAVLCPALIDDPNAVLTRTCGVYNHSLAEAVIFGIMYWEKQTPRLEKLQKAHVWERFIVHELRGHTMVVVGFGNIGQTVAHRATAMGCHVIGVRRRPVAPEDEEKIADKSIAERVVDGSKLHEVLGVADYVACVLPLTPETHKAFGKAEIDAMKPGALFVNIGRGPTIDEAALAEALRTKKIRGAYVDVVEKEPLDKDSPLWDLDNILISAHTIDWTDVALPDAFELVKENLERFMDKKELLHIADKKAGY